MVVGAPREFSMILFNLRCAADHEFEAWFRDGATYEDQAASGGDRMPGPAARPMSGKAIMAPRVARTAKKRSGGVSPAEFQRQYTSAMRAVRKHVEENCDYVGPGFAEEARKIHDGSSEEAAASTERRPRPRPGR